MEQSNRAKKKEEKKKRQRERGKLRSTSVNYNN